MHIFKYAYLYIQEETRKDRNVNTWSQNVMVSSYCSRSSKSTEFSDVAKSKMPLTGAIEVAQRIRVLDALPECLDSIHRTPHGDCNSSSRESYDLFCPPWLVLEHVHTYTQTKHSYT